MTAHDPHFAREPRGILRWLGLGSSGDDAPPPVADAPEQSTSEDSADTWRERRRRQLMADITSFLLTHRLEVNAGSLAIAHDVITGANPALARLIEERVAARLPVSPAWLEDALRRTGRADGHAMLDELMHKLESSIEDFGRTTSAARSATTQYNDALEEQVGELERVSTASNVITELASIAKIMLDRTRRIEEEMIRSEEQTAQLQKRLEKARREAEIDHLTGLPNRRAFDAFLKAEVKEAESRGEPLSVAFCDIDHFKRVNDSHGHDAGDRVLRSVARVLAKISDDRCHVARHGGEEFVVLLRGQDLDAAYLTLDRARAELAEKRFVNRATDIPFGRITFSGGIANVLAHANPREALRAADDALYAAKASGRNRILREGEAPPRPSE